MSAQMDIIDLQNEELDKLYEFGEPTKAERKALDKRWDQMWKMYSHSVNDVYMNMYKPKRK